MEEAAHLAAGNDAVLQAGTSAATEAERWSELPEDLIRAIHAKFVSPLDSVRFAAVCTSWRAVVPTHPWLILDPSGVGDAEKHNGAILPRFQFPREAIGRSFIGGHDGGWVAFLEPPLRIMNLLSGAEVTLFVDDWFLPMKVIFSKPPTSSDCILAAITGGYEVAICGLGHLNRTWARGRCNWKPVVDIAFCNGDLYCLTSWKEIFKFEVGMDHRSVAVLKSVHLLDIQNQTVVENLYLGYEGDPDAHAIYIVELRGNLVMAVRRTKGPRSWSRNTCGPFFLVLELVHADTNRVMAHRSYRWEEMTSLGDHALFLGPTCAKAMHVSLGQSGGPRRNHVYYTHHRCYARKERLPDDAKEFMTSSKDDGCHVYYKEDESIDDSMEGITSVGYHVLSGAQIHPLMWLLPPCL